jgi:hypothetical protein
MPCNTREENAAELAAEEAEKTTKPKPFITTIQGGSGWFAVHYWWNDEDIPGKGFWEPWDTGFGRYSSEEKAIEEAQSWADAEGLDYVPREKPPG